MICAVSDGRYHGRLNGIVPLLGFISFVVEVAVLSGKIFPTAMRSRVVLQRRTKKS